MFSIFRGLQEVAGPGTNEDVLMALRRIAELKTEGLEDGEYGDFGR